MTRATLLHVLEHATALGAAEVRELEQLAHAFPYCQTAHLLLAKAAHDQGTMLAGQRLRRAATYAADRTLLRRLIEQVEPAQAQVQEAPLEVEVAPAATPVEVEAKPEAVDVAAATEEAVAPAATGDQTAVPVALPAAEPAPLPANDNTPAVEPEQAPMPAEATAPPVALLIDLPVPIAEQLIDLPVPIAEQPQAAQPIEQPEQLADAFIEEPAIPVEEPALPVEEPDSAATAEAPAPKEEELPAVAPAIRPSAEVGEARFEFGLADAPPPAVPTYELPGLVDEWAAAATTLSLGAIEPLPEILAAEAKATQEPAFTPAAFTGDDAIGYGLGESSRLGFSMQLLNLLTDKAEAEAASAVAAAQPSAAPLPPAGAFFEPDPLLLDHWATHCPPPPVLPSSLDLINNFLRRQPRLTRPAMLPPLPGTQADLSVRSTRAEPDLASESLARILVRQGKTARAIEIYEKLMVKQPEKMAYFAAQIQQLQPPA